MLKIYKAVTFLCKDWISTMKAKTSTCTSILYKKELNTHYSEKENEYILFVP